MIRGYQSRSKDTKGFLKTVIKAIGLEFDEEVKLEDIDNDFIITMKNYKVKITKEQAQELKSPYGLDRYIMNEFRKQGFDFEITRSQYIQYCYGNYIGASVYDEESDELIPVNELKTEFCD